MQTTVQILESSNLDGEIGDLISGLKARYHNDGRQNEPKGAAYHSQERAKKPAIERPQ